MAIRVNMANLGVRVNPLWQRLVRWVEASYTDHTILPLTLFLRAGFLVEMISRFYSRPIPQFPQYRLFWGAAITAYAVYLVVLCLYAFRNARVFTSDRSKYAQILVDISFCAIFFVLNGDPESNLVLTFLLPLLIATRYFSTPIILKVFVLVILIVAAGLAIIGLSLIYVPPQFNHSLERIFFIRSVLFACLTWPLARSTYLNHLIVNRTRESRRRLDLLITQNVELARHEDIASLLEQATTIAGKELKAETAALFLYRDGCFRRQKLTGLDDQWFVDEIYAPGQGITGQVGIGRNGTAFGEPIRDNHADSSTMILHDHLAKYRSQLPSGRVAHLLAVPLNGSNRTFGILRVVNKRTSEGKLDANGFTEDDQDTLSSIAALIALALSSARREQKMQSAFEVNETLTKTFDQQQVCQKIVDVIAGVGYRASCLLLREAHDRFTIRAFSGIPAEAVQALQQMPGIQAERLEISHTGLPGSRLNMQAVPLPDVVTWATKYQFCSVLRLPLLQQQEVIGILEIYTGTPYTFSAEEIGTLNAFVSQATMAIVNARLSEQNQAQITRLKELSEQNQEQIDRLKELAALIGSMITHSDRDKLFQDVAHKAAALLRAEDCSLFWIDRKTGTIDGKASHCIPQLLFKPGRTRVSAVERAGFPAYVAATGEVLAFVGDEYKAHKAWNGTFLDHLSHLPSRRCSSLLVYPIIDQHNTILGVIKAENKLGIDRRAGFTEVDHDLIMLIATQIAIAVHKIEQVEQLRHLHKVARTITEPGEQRDVLRRIARSAYAVGLADIAVICPYDADKDELLVDEAATYGQQTNARLMAKPRESGLTQEVLQVRKGYVIVQDLDQEPDKLNQFADQEGVKSFIAMALKVRSKPVGILYCDFRQVHRFSEEEIRNVQAFGELAAIAIDNAKLFSDLKGTVRELSAIQKLTTAALGEIDDLDSVLDMVLDTLCETLDFSICTVSLVNEADRTIQTRKARGVPSEWVVSAKHSLEDTEEREDIQSYIVRTGETEVIAGWDKRFDQEIYTRFNHERLVRVFTPIWIGERVIGTVEAGYERRYKPTITDEQVETLQRYLKQVALVIENARSREQEQLHTEQLEKLYTMSQNMSRSISEVNVSSVLKMAADMAALVAGPESSAAIYIYRKHRKRLGVEAWSGAQSEYVEQLVGPEVGDHLQILDLAEPLDRPGHHNAKAGVPSIYIPLRVRGENYGALCVVYHRDHWFTSNERKLFGLFATQAAVVIGNAQTHQQLSRRLDGLSYEMVRSLHAGLAPALNIACDALVTLLDERQFLGPLNQVQSDRLRTVLQRLKVQREQVKQLLLLRRLEEAQFRLVPVETHIGLLVEESIISVEAQLQQHRIALVCDAPSLNYTVVLDQARVKETVIELLTNAIKFTPAGGRIEITGQEDQKAAYLTIRDTGRGIPPESLDEIFQKNVQIPPFLSNQDAGTGFGLYIAQRFMHLQGGSITVESQLGHGSAFTIVFPRSMLSERSEV